MSRLEAVKAAGRYSMVGGPFGSKLVSHDYVDDAVPVIRGVNLPSDSRFSFDNLVFVTEEKVASDLFGNLAYPGDVVVTQRGTLGQVGLIPEDSAYPRFVVSQSQMKLTVDRLKADPPFVYYALRSPVGQQGIHGRAMTAGVPHINLALFQQLEIPLPPLPTQQKIAAILTAYDDLIENNNRRIKLLEEMAQRLYREWFVDFRFPGHENVPLVDSGLGLLPEGWRVSPLSSVADIVRGRSYRKNDLVETGGLPFVNLKCLMRGGGFRLDGLKRYRGQYDSDQEVREGDIVLGVTDLTQQREILARATLVPRLDDDFGVISLDVVRIVPRSIDDRLALFFALSCTDFADRVKEFANGSTVLHLSPTHVAQNSLLWPPRELRRQFVGIVEPIVRIISALAEARKSLALTRDLLLPRLISGDVDVTDLDIAMPEAAA